ncbi:MAG: cytochrome c class I [Flavobacterium sp.]|nr:MAG: cytochrome c class I [Flavobacterium sp.]
MKSKNQLLIIASLVVLFTVSVGFSTMTQGKWVAPASADKLENPLKGDEAATSKGKKIYKQMCAICHGMKGKGDGMAGSALKPKPANFTKAEIQEDSDGAIFWKITEGRGNMVSYKETLSETQRWQLVNFIRTFK